MAREKKARSAIKDVIAREYTINLHKVTSSLIFMNFNLCKGFCCLTRTFELPNASVLPPASGVQCSGIKDP